MASVIKAGKVIRGGNSVQPTEFNLEDVSQQASAYLDTVRKQAEQILTQAHQQAKQIVTQAAQEGRQAAEAAARDAALKEFENRWQTLAPALNQAIEGTSQLKASWLKQWENNAVHLVVAVAQRELFGQN